MITLEIWNDDCAGIDSPNDWHGWRFISFDNRHVGAESAYDYFDGRDESGDLIPANIGIRRKLECGTAFVVSCYSHGSDHYSLAGSGPQCRFDTTNVAGILLWDHSPKDLPKGFKAREQSAQQFLETYTAWANGWIYGFTLESEDGGFESCGGFYSPEDLKDDVTTILGDKVPDEITGDASWIWNA